MTPAQIKAWLGFPESDPRELRDEIIKGMADVPNPPAGPTDEHLAVFKAFLGCVGGPPFVLFKDQVFTNQGTDYVIVVVEPPGTGPDRPRTSSAARQSWGDKGCVRDPSRCRHGPDDGCEWCCMTCNVDQHFCPVCGAVSDHKQTPCPEHADARK